MKLLDKNNRIFFRFTALLLVFGSALFYFAVEWIIRHEIDEKLEVNYLRTAELLQKGENIPHFAPLVEVFLIRKKLQTKPVYSDTMIFDLVEKEDEPYRQFLADTIINGTPYRIVNRTSLVEKDELMLAIGSCTLALALLLFAGLYWLNRRSAKKLWKPFQLQLEALKNYSLTQREPLTLPSSDISEFEELKAALLQLTDKVQDDYRNLKEFTENTSHETQTPLAIIRSKIETLIENENLSDEQMLSVSTVYEAANRLSRLNQGLLLLAKIENRQFGEATELSVDTIVKEQVEMLAELTEAKNLYLKAELSNELRVAANRPLVEILIKNLLENAIRYSQPGDTILMQSTKAQLSFTNPGSQPIKQPERLFERFHKQGNHNSSLGLGLAIVKKICGVYTWDVSYSFEGERHVFTVQFS